MPESPVPLSPPEILIRPEALWTAGAHAQEANRPTPLVHDPWAAEFLAAAGFTGGPPGNGPLQQLLPDWMVVRTRFFDDFLLAAAETGRRQVVLLGAGLDARAFRLEWPDGVRVFEVDDASVFALKERVLGGRRPPRAERTVVEADLAADWGPALIAAGFDPARPTAWLCESPLYFREPDQVAAVAAVMAALSAPGSTFSAECVNARAAGSPFVAPFLTSLASRGLGWHWQIGDPVNWWGSLGWATQVADLFALPYAMERFATLLPFLTKAGAAKVVFLVTGVR
ncbi:MULTISPECIES: SAM-dependent methyltransferase [Streptomycetaceae]|uniref:S-adenosyl-L-methionine-dependent methyltransferase n=1 Tax=Streptantibioticus cattleyicolor (strain ATCC 35852 / DSM 46488 / JCM 4925 / NBRC 14057 / NRRL 8057) TaxID=1003195 RepID=F8JSR0_STREN|nr:MULTISPECIES: SAM-dependent methyltransferase [Streptomycetaceae]AEW97965.1 putative secreted protein [Streptantibioticus cattleyicolor NRRL 8057 = DSM 46488]MYS62367.1 SAM-dependent methyltransferase [Streptomyces sp. SID5468]CCB78284.1 putative secreted protein [Streptantibioticus cattleyicolor NRRL 8057 = DSM 46488]